ncbi:MAG: hypothetical protein ACTSYJ_09240, partial [Candidatus Thorarchaeota archaeon]
MYFTQRAEHPEVAPLRMPVGFVRTILVVSSLSACIVWYSYGVPIPEEYVIYTTFIVAYYIPLMRELIREEHAIPE